MQFDKRVLCAIPPTALGDRWVHAEDLPPYEAPSTATAAEPGVLRLQARLEQPADPDTLSVILKSVDGNIESAAELLRESGLAVRPGSPLSPLPGTQPINSISVCRAHTVESISPRKRKAAQRGVLAPGSPMPGSPLPGSPLRGLQPRRLGPSGTHASAVVSQHTAVPTGDDGDRELAINENVWWWNSERSIWVEASVVWHNPSQLALEYTVKLPSGMLTDSVRGHLRSRCASQPLPPLPLPRASGPGAVPATLAPLRSGNAAATVAAADRVATRRDSSPGSSSPMIVEHTHSPSATSAAARHVRGPSAHGSNAQPLVETREFRDLQEESVLRVARELQEEQDRSLALKMASELPPEAAALPESDDDDNIGLLAGEEQAVATQNLYARLNQPVKELIEQIKDTKAHREEERASRNFHAVGQLTFEVRLYRMPVFRPGAVHSWGAAAYPVCSMCTAWLAVLRGSLLPWRMGRVPCASPRRHSGMRHAGSCNGEETGRDAGRGCGSNASSTQPAQSGGLYSGPARPARGSCTADADRETCVRRWQPLAWANAAHHHHRPRQALGCEEPLQAA